MTKGQRRIVKAVSAKIESDIKEHTSIEIYAKAYGVSPSSLKKYFWEVYGQTISEYRKELQMDRAKVLLERSNLSILDISQEVGYANQGKFASAFKKKVGLAPIEYRRQMREI